MSLLTIGPKLLTSDSRIIDGTLTKSLCVACGLGFSSSVNVIRAGHYADDYILDVLPESFNVEYNRTRSEKIASDIDSLVSRHRASTQASILDVGCGSGRLMAQLKKRWSNSSAVGIEPNNAARKQASNFGFTVYESVSELQSHSFDIVTCIAVLEHVNDPVMLMQQMAQLLSPDGLIVIAVPSRAMRSHDLWVADHYFHYMGAHIEHMARSSGMTYVDAIVSDNSSSLSYYLFRKLPTELMQEPFASKDWLAAKEDSTPFRYLLEIERDSTLTLIDQVYNFIHGYQNLYIYGIGERFMFLNSVEQLRPDILQAYLVDDNQERARLIAKRTVSSFEELTSHDITSSRWLCTWDATSKLAGVTDTLIAQ